MIVVQVMGGLGNQMFQYACGRAVALRSAKQLYLDVLDVHRFPVDTVRPYELDKLNIQATPLYSLEEVLAVGRGLGLKSMQVYQERQLYCFDPSIIAIRDNAILAAGYWQSERYFQDFAEVIRQELTPNINCLSVESLDLASEINQYQSIAVHVRRGDYKKINNVLPIDYYQTAINYFTARISEPHFYIFSDDVEWCKNEFMKFAPNAQLVQHTFDKGSHEDLWLMSQCKHNIIANSSYSWWGAWLNKNVNKIVVAPEEWCSSPCTTLDLIPNDWIKLSIHNGKITA
ncbi:MAG: glycosyl transferase family 11 [Firmicutes bacterium]|nr:glycosyl transferase family 11 [Bacillota bacterium]